MGAAAASAGDAGCGLGVPQLDAAASQVPKLINQFRHSDMLLCLDKNDGKRPRPRVVGEVHQRCEALLKELFKVHDLNKDGMLGEAELVQLNKKVALLHYGREAHLGEVETKYKDLFRRSLDAQGKPVPYATFRRYMVEVLMAIDTCSAAQEMILEQFIAEASAARAAFHVAGLAIEGDAQFLSYISFDEACNTAAAIDTMRWDTPRVHPHSGPGSAGPQLALSPPSNVSASDRLLGSRCGVAPPPSWSRGESRDRDSWRLAPSASMMQKPSFNGMAGGDGSAYGSAYASTRMPSGMMNSPWGSHFGRSGVPGGPPISACASSLPYEPYEFRRDRGGYPGGPEGLLPLPPPPPPAPPRRSRPQGHSRANVPPHLVPAF